MKIGGIRDGTLYCTRGLDVVVWDESAGFRRRGRLPNPASGIEQLSFDLLNRRLPKRLLGPLLGSYTTTNVWQLRDENLLATVSRWLFTSSDGGRSWQAVRELPASSGMMGVLPTSVCEHDGRVYLAEYPLGDEPARVLVSDDHGRTWSIFVERTDYRHFHGLFIDPYTGRLWGTTGDTDGESAIGVFTESGFEPVGSGSQRWRAVQLAFTPDTILWGKDCSYAEEGEILKLPRDRLAADAPHPDVVGTIDCPIYYAETLTVGNEQWVVLSTTAEPEIDSTAPDADRRNTCGTTARVLAASSASGYEHWYELYTAERKNTLGKYLGPVPLSNSYLFLATDPELGVVINPYNTSQSNGKLIRVPPSAFENHDFTVYDGRARTTAARPQQ
jgi:hypothetical protein